MDSVLKQAKPSPPGRRAEGNGRPSPSPSLSMEWTKAQAFRDLASELGQVEAVSRGLNSPTFQALDELPEPHERSAEPTLESFALPTIAPARAPTERALLPRSACRARASKPNPPWLDSKSFGRNRTPICRNRSQAGRRSQHPGWKAKWPLLSNGT